MPIDKLANVDLQLLHDRTGPRARAGCWSPNRQPQARLPPVSDGTAQTPSTCEHEMHCVYAKTQARHNCPCGPARAPRALPPTGTPWRTANSCPSQPRSLCASACDRKDFDICPPGPIVRPTTPAYGRTCSALVGIVAKVRLSTLSHIATV